MATKPERFDAPVRGVSRGAPQARPQRQWPWRLTFAALAAAPLALTLTGCETKDACALRQAACVDVALLGKRDDGIGNQVAYRNLTIKVFAPNPTASQPAPEGKCVKDGPYGADLTASPEPFDLTPQAPYIAGTQGLVSFQLPDAFNDLADNPPGMVVDDLPSTAQKVAKLKELRSQDLRAVRIVVFQDAKPVWDSRCDEDAFSSDEWTMKKYYRIGKNEYRAVYAALADAMTSAP